MSTTEAMDTSTDVAMGGTIPETTPAPPAPTNDNLIATDLPANRFELELEFVQALASPAYLHFLATSRVEDSAGASGGLLLQDPDFQAYLKYLQKTWTDPAYSRFLSYPHSLYFLEQLIEKPAALKEWTLPAFRNFCHQQQFASWQHRHAVLYGQGSHNVDTATAVPNGDASDGAVPATSSAP